MNIGDFFQINMKEQLYCKFFASLSLLVEPVSYTKHVLSMHHSIITYGLELDQYFLTCFVRHCFVQYKHTYKLTLYDNQHIKIRQRKSINLMMIAKGEILDKRTILHLVCVTEMIVSFSAIGFGLTHHQSVTLG